MTDQSRTYIIQRKSGEVETVIGRLVTTQMYGQPVLRCEFPEGTVVLQDGDSLQGPYSASEAERISAQMVADTLEQFVPPYKCVKYGSDWFVVDSRGLSVAGVENNGRPPLRYENEGKDYADFMQRRGDAVARALNVLVEVQQIPEGTQRTILNAHMVDVRVRINGRWVTHEADWLKDILQAMGAKS